MRAIEYQLLQVAFQESKLCQASPDVGELVLGEQPGPLASTIALNLQQAGNLVQRETHRLGAADELQAAKLGRSVPTYCAKRPFGFRQQSASLVVAHGFDMHEGGSCQLPDSESFGIHAHPLTPYHGTDPTLRVEFREAAGLNDKHRVTGAAAGAISISGIAVFLGTCCVTPLGVVLFGVTGAVALARLTYLQPYFLVAALALLGLTFWYAYRRPPTSANAACDLASRRRFRVLAWVAAVFVLLLAALSIAPFLLS